MDAPLSPGNPAPSFSLSDLDGNTHALSDYQGQVLVINFWSAECPWSRRADERLAPKLASLGPAVALLFIASNINEPAEAIAEEAARRGVSPILLDPEHQVADLYQARTTPQYFVIDRRSILRFQGAPDNATFRQRNATQEYLVPAIEAVLAGVAPDLDSVLPYGCTIVRFSGG